jgi:uncharacterized protein (TIGR03435 family)
VSFVVFLRAFVMNGAAAQQFEVASVKQNTSGDGREFIGFGAGGRVTFTNVPARQLITAAYQLPPFQLAGGPSWIDSDRFDIVGKLAGEPPAAAPPRPDGPQMLAMRALLADRFKLKLHKETRQLDVYNLVMLKPGVTGPSLKTSTTDCAAIAAARRGGAPPPPPNPNAPMLCGIQSMPGLIRMGGVPLAPVVQMLTNQSQRLVFDHTNLTGNWDLTLKFAFEQRGQPPPGANVPPPDPDAPSLFTAIQEQLGLKLEPAKAPVEVTVIDSIEHPTDD